MIRRAASRCAPLLLALGAGLGFRGAPRPTGRVPRLVVGQDTGPRDSLFADEDTLRLTLATDLGKLLRDRDTLHASYHAATLAVARAGGADTIPVRVRTRGIFRRQAANCSFPPLRLAFPHGSTKHTIFAGESRLKLVTHCRGGHRYEQYLLQEYRLYKLYGLLTPRGFRVRLARLVYVDTAHGARADTALAFLIESPESVARRTGTVAIDAPGADYAVLDHDAFGTMALFEYMIGNTDWSIPVRHNVDLLRDSSGTLIPVPYDFDFSGVIAAPYAAPDPRLPIHSVRERIFRGLCGSASDYAPVIARFEARRAAVDSLYGEQTGIDRAALESTRRYFAEFYDVLRDPHRFEGEVHRRCK